MPCAVLPPCPSVFLSTSGILDSRHFLSRLEIHHGEAVEFGELRVGAPGRAIRIRVERHRPDAQVEIVRPHRHVGLGVDHGHVPRADHAGDRVLPVRRHVGVVHAAMDRDRPGLRLLGRVNHVDRPRGLRDGHIELAAIRRNRQVVGVAAERDLLRHLHRLAVDDVDRVVGLVADPHRGPVGRGRGAVRPFDPGDLGHDLVRRGVDDVHGIAGAVGLDDPDQAAAGRRQRQREHEERQRRESKCQAI